MKKLVILFIALSMSILFFSCEDGSSPSTPSGPSPTDFTSINDGTVSKELFDLSSAFMTEQMSVMNDMDDDTSGLTSLFNDAMTNGTNNSPYNYIGPDYSCKITVTTFSMSSDMTTMTVVLKMEFTMTYTNLAVSFTDANGYKTNGSISGTGTYTMDMNYTVDMSTQVQTGTMTSAVKGTYAVKGFPNISNVSFDFSMVRDASDNSINSMAGTYTIDSNTYNVIDFQSYIPN